LLFTEGVVNLHGLGEGIRFVEADGYTEARVDVPPVYLCENLLERRSLLSNAACGVCGKRDMDALRLDRPALEPGQRAAAGVIPSLAGEMRSRQASFLKTGGSHAAAAFTVEGEFLVQFEDVGRHNAVDKVIGQLIIGGVLARAGILMVSGRVSFEIVSKARAAGIRVLCAVSAPSSMAVEWAEKSGVALVAFCRDDRYTIYTHAEHLEF
jgi:FdhD protein